MPQPHPETASNRMPLAYFITFRTYGTWLHGDERGSIDRFHNVYDTPRLPPNRQRQKYERSLLVLRPVKLGSKRREAVEKAVRETCRIRKWQLWAFNIRTNHVHSVVSANCEAWQVLNALKANATRVLRESGYWQSKHSPWARRGSKIVFGLNMIYSMPLIMCFTIKVNRYHSLGMLSIPSDDNRGTAQ